MSTSDYSRLEDTKRAANARTRAKKLAELTAKEEATFTEFLRDALASPKLNEWEKDFTESLRKLHNKGIVRRLPQLSDRQRAMIAKIQVKIYAAG